MAVTCILIPSPVHVWTSPALPLLRRHKRSVIAQKFQKVHDFLRLFIHDWFLSSLSADGPSLSAKPPAVGILLARGQAIGWLSHACNTNGNIDSDIVYLDTILFCRFKLGASRCTMPHRCTLVLTHSQGATRRRKGAWLQSWAHGTA